MQFTKLRLEGFKSFVDPTELVIESGLTGVVGPNGCGKSNLLEALRWVMGESRARQMRGDGMEDVIFAGAEGRPARARAHVELVIDNTAATAPLAWREQPLLEITRRIVRDTGSDYRVNGKSVRARDVQMLFADAATGAASPALVRQGQIAELINAKPKARRRILEDAAGISGLYQRRHESLLKLRDAETNLSRIDDVLEAMAQQLAALERQAGAARRYRALAAELRTAEETLLQVRHARAAATHDTALRGRAEALRKLARAETEGQAAERAQEAAEAALEPVREEETIAAALLQRLTIERERLDERAETAEGEIASVRAMMRELEEDRAREARLAEDAAAATDRLSQAEADLDRAADGAEERIEAAREKARQASEAQRAADEALDAASARAAEAAAAHESAQRRFADAAAAAERAQAQHTRLSNEAPGVAEAASAASTAAKEANAEAQAAAATLAEAEEALADASRNRSTTLERQDTTARDRAAAEAALAAVSAERRGLERLVGRDRAQTGLIDQLSVDPGWEAALGAALGDDLELAVLSEHPSAPATGWHPEPAKHDAHRLKTAVALDRLESFVAAPPALTQRLSAIWVVEAADGGALQASLPPGGRLVSREGDLWRWDGLCRRAADAPSAAALRLTQLNRLKALQKDESGALETFETADNAARDAAEASTEAGRVEALSRQSRNEAATEANEAARRAAKAGIAEDEASARERAHQ
ncbi:MAG: AAA family ATPase, partial [Pseudomonadota bacterium]